MSSKPLPTRTPALAALLIAGLAISACGYRPLYGQNPAAPSTQRHLESINVLPIPDRVGQMMRTALTRRLSPRGNRAVHAYDVSITLNENVSTLAVEQNAFATRANLKLTANYRLTRRTDQLTLTSGSINSVASYNILASEFATKAAKDDSRSRAIVDASERIRTRLAVYFQGPGQKQPPIKSANAQSGNTRP